MTYRGEVEDGAGWGGLVPSKTELREERMQIEITLLRAEKKDLVKQRDDLVHDNLAMTSEIERLKAEKEHYIKVWSDVCDENQGLLNEIERLKAELEAETQRRWDGNRIASAEATADFNEMRDMAVKEMARWAREAGASQAREAKLREIIDRMDYREGNKVPYGDSTALQEAIKQGQRAVAEHILEMWRDPWPRTERSFIDRLEAYVQGQREADELWAIEL
jgi:hypothetical protein